MKYKNVIIKVICFILSMILLLCMSACSMNTEIEIDTEIEEPLISNVISINGYSCTLPMLLDEFLEGVGGVRDYTNVPNTLVAVGPYENEYAAIIIENDLGKSSFSATVFHDKEGNYYISGISFGGMFDTKITELSFPVYVFDTMLNSASIGSFPEAVSNNLIFDSTQYKMDFTFFNKINYVVSGIFTIKQENTNSEFETIARYELTKFSISTENNQNT